MRRRAPPSATSARTSTDTKTTTSCAPSATSNPPSTQKRKELAERTPHSQTRPKAALPRRLPRSRAQNRGRERGGGRAGRSEAVTAERTVHEMQQKDGAAGLQLRALQFGVLQGAQAALGPQLLGGLHRAGTKEDQDGQPPHLHQEDRRYLICFSLIRTATRAPDYA